MDNINLALEERHHSATTSLAEDQTIRRSFWAFFFGPIISLIKLILVFAISLALMAVFIAVVYVLMVTRILFSWYAE
jgi:VIT1/CCC1 family predicted Fe2+/Mn2+ transporter